MKLANIANRTSLVWLLLPILFVLIHGTDLLAQTCVQPPLGMIAWWPMDETSGTTVQDVAGNHPGIHVNSPAFAAGQVGGALRFNGVDNYVGVGDSDDWAFGTGDFTVELWANFSSPGGGSIGHPSHIFVGNDEGPGSVNKWFFALGGGFLNFHINSPTIGPKFFPLVPFSPTLNRWYHLAATRSGNVYTIYVFGVAMGSAVNEDSIPNANAPLTIGQAESLGFMNGILDELTIYRRALTQAELLAIVDAGNAGKCKNLAISTRFVPTLQLQRTSSFKFDSQFGKGLLTWSVAGGMLPNGMTLSSDGVLSGSPTAAGQFNYSIMVTDSTGASAAKAFTQDVVLIAPPPNLTLQKSGTVAVPGRILDYFLVLQNNGSVDANNIEIMDLLRPELRLISVFPSGTTDSVTLAAASLVHWIVPTLHPSEARVFSYQARLDAATPIGSILSSKAYARPLTGSLASMGNVLALCEIICYSCPFDRR